MLYSPDDQVIVEQVAEIASERGMSRAQVGLSADEIARLEAPYTPHQVVGFR